MKVLGIDPSAEFVAYSAAAFDDPRASFVVGNAMELDFEAGEFDVAAAALVLNFVPDPARAVSEMRRVVRRPGIVAAYVWDYAGEMQMMRLFWDAAVELDPAARELDEGVRFRICNPLALRACFESAGLENVEVRRLDCDMTFTDFDDYWTVEVRDRGEAAEERRLRTLGPGDYFGEIGLLEGIARTATVTALSDCRLFRVEGDVFLEALTNTSATSAFLANARAGLALTNPSLIPSRGRRQATPAPG